MRPGRWYSFYTMEFEYDPVKSRINKEKHGIDFQEAQALWEDTDLVEIPARTSDELRFVVMGKIGDKHWSAIVTYRGSNVRIISVRHSRKEEVSVYEG